MQPSYSTNVFKEVYSTNNLLVFQFGQNCTVNAYISKKFIRGLERPIVKGNLFVSNKTITNNIGQHVIPLRETDSNKLLHPKLFTMFHINSISTWVALLTSYLAYIWSQVRHMSYNYFLETQSQG
jgi:hypothetical protein